MKFQNILLTTTKKSVPVESTEALKAYWYYFPPMSTGACIANLFLPLQVYCTSPLLQRQPTLPTFKKTGRYASAVDLL
jgi:hypothetical protein